MPFQLQFAIDELKLRAPNDPQLAADPMVQAALRGDFPSLLAGKGHDGLLHILALTHTGMTTDEFDDRVSAWLASAKHPRFDRPYDQLAYVPQLQLLNCLRANGFRTYIVSGGGADFMRVFSERMYGIPPEQVVGSTGTVEYEIRLEQGIQLIAEKMQASRLGSSIALTCPPARRYWRAMAIRKRSSASM